MSRKKRNTLIGFYLPSFIRMHVETDASLTNLNTLNDDGAEAIYIHEYIHFIQDVTSTYGFFNTYVIGEYMRMANNTIVANPKGGFAVPVEPIPAGADNVAVNLNLANFLSGTGDDHDITLTNHQLRTEQITTSTTPLQIEVVEIEYTDSNGNPQTFDFGELCVSESMAYIIERECYPNCPPPPELPYLSAEKLVDLIYPQFGNNCLNILALCDLSLMQQNPGKFFYETLLHFQTNNLTFDNPEDIYTWCYNLQNFDNGLNQFFGLAQQNLTTYLNDRIFDEINNWLNNMLTNALNHRRQNETFILNIARGGKLKDNAAFKQFLMCVGSPLVTNANGETTLYNPNTNADLNYSLILALDQVHSVFWFNQRKCDLVELCSEKWHNVVNLCNKNKPIVDLRCETEPWTRSEDKKLCPFGIVWRHWQLTGYYPE
jgi:hypothetical protein